MQSKHAVVVDHPDLNTPYIRPELILVIRRSLRLFPGKVKRQESNLRIGL
jgi:hypothetical protein